MRWFSTILTVQYNASSYTILQFTVKHVSLMKKVVYLLDAVIIATAIAITDIALLFALQSCDWRLDLGWRCFPDLTQDPSKAPSNDAQCGHRIHKRAPHLCTEQAGSINILSDNWWPSGSAHPCSNLDTSLLRIGLPSWNSPPLKLKHNTTVNSRNITTLSYDAPI